MLVSHFENLNGNIAWPDMRHIYPILLSVGFHDFFHGIGTDGPMRRFMSISMSTSVVITILLAFAVLALHCRWILDHRVPSSDQQVRDNLDELNVNPYLNGFRKIYLRLFLNLEANFSLSFCLPSHSLILHISPPSLLVFFYVEQSVVVSLCRWFSAVRIIYNNFATNYRAVVNA